MRFKINFIASIILSLIAISGCCKHEELFGSLSGIVKEAKGGTAISGALVSLSSGDTQTTQSDGSFLFKDLKQGEYTISVTKDGYFSEKVTATVKSGEVTGSQITLSSSKPEISISTASLDFGAEQGTLTFDISNDSKSELKWEIVDVDEWISCSEMSGSLTDGKTSVIVRIDRTKMGPGNYSGAIVIVSNGGSKSIPVSARVEDINLTAKPASLDFSTLTTSIPFTIINTSGMVISYFVSTSNDWISVNKKEGSIIGTDSFTASVSRSGLASGTFSGVIYIGTKKGALVIPVKMEVATNQKPTVTVQDASNETYNSAVFHGNLISVGSEKVTSYGFCWSEKNNPTLSDKVANLGDCSEPVQFEYKATNLKALTKYYVRSYAINGTGTAYSEQIITFTTADMPSSPAVNTGDVSEISSSCAKVSGTLTSLGNVESVTHYGHVWSKSPKPTLGSCEFTDFGKTTSVLSFSSEMTNLDAATTYYVRAYATNEVGTSYGEEVEFKTQKSNPDLITLEANNITSTGASCGGKIVSSGGHTFSERGVCWSESSQPTISDQTCKSTEITSDTYHCQITGLKAETNYYYRAYIKSDEGKIFYGDIKIFTTTSKSTIPSVSITSIENITQNSATVSAKINDIGASDVNETGICWSVNISPTINDHCIKCLKSTSFTAKLNDLPVETTIYVRAYAINSYGIGYSETQTFNTLKAQYDIWDGSIATSFAGGSGLENDPIIIRTSAQLALLSKNVYNMSSYSGVYFKLENDLDLNNIKWSPIGSSTRVFSGSFNGNGHKIKGIYISGKEYSAGLFGWIANCLISNLEIFGSITDEYKSIYSGDGGLCGQATNSIISNIINHCTVKGYNNVGGICGYASEVNIYNSHNYGDISGDWGSTEKSNTGGIVGYYVCKNNTHEIVNCSNYATSYSSETSGGIVGWAFADDNAIINIENCCNLGEDLRYNTGGIIGCAEKEIYSTSNGKITLSNCVSTSQKVGTSPWKCCGICGKTEYISTNNWSCYWLFDRSRNLGIENGNSGGSSYYISSSSTCVTFPDGKDILTILNNWVQNKGADKYYKWKYEIICGLPCPVLNTL